MKIHQQEGNGVDVHERITVVNCVNITGPVGLAVGSEAWLLLCNPFMALVVVVWFLTVDTAGCTVVEDVTVDFLLSLRMLSWVAVLQLR